MFLSDIATIPQTFQEGSVGLVRSMAHTGSMGVQDSLSPSRHSWEPFVFFFFQFTYFAGSAQLHNPYLLSLLVFFIAPYFPPFQRPKPLEVKSPILGDSLITYSPGQITRSRFWGDANPAHPALGRKRTF